jgi:hypothetical protein
MKDRLKKAGIGASLLAAFALGGSAVASALSSESDGQTEAAVSSPADSSEAPESPRAGSSNDPSEPQRTDEELLTGDTATRVQDAALAEVDGGTIERVETDADGNAAYEAHMVAPDGSRVTVYVDEQFNVVSVDDSPGHGRHGPGGQGQGEEGPATNESSDL